MRSLSFTLIAKGGVKRGKGTRDRVGIVPTKSGIVLYLKACVSCLTIVSIGSGSCLSSHDPYSCLQQPLCKNILLYMWSSA